MKCIPLNLSGSLQVLSPESCIYSSFPYLKFSFFFYILDTIHFLFFAFYFPFFLLSKYIVTSYTSLPPVCFCITLTLLASFLPPSPLFPALFLCSLLLHSKFLRINLSFSSTILTPFSLVSFLTSSLLTYSIYPFLIPCFLPSLLSSLLLSSSLIWFPLHLDDNAVFPNYVQPVHQNVASKNKE